MNQILTAAVARMPSPECGQDDVLAVRFADGDLEVFHEVVELHSQRVTALVHRLLGWPDEVEDVVQDVFLAALKRRRSFRGGSKLSTWLAGIAVNQCRRHRRWRGRRLNFLARLWSHAPERTSAASHERVLVDEQQQRVRDLVGELPDSFREVIVLRYLEDMKPPEISRVLNVSVNVVNVRLSRAREKLQGMLAKFAEK